MNKTGEQAGKGVPRVRVRPFLKFPWINTAAKVEGCVLFERLISSAINVYSGCVYFM